MPPRILKDIIVVDRSTLACNMYQLLFTPQLRFRVRFSNEYESLMKRSPRLRPDLLVVNSNALSREELGQNKARRFPCPAILICSRDRFDLKEEMTGRNDVILIEKPFYPYDLIALANRLINQPKGKKRGRKRKEISK